MNMNRRFFLGGALAVAGSAFVPLVGFAKPQLKLWGDGVHDDTEALNALFAGEDVACEDVAMVRQGEREVWLKGGEFRISNTLKLGGRFTILGADFKARDWKGDENAPMVYLPYQKEREDDPNLIDSCLFDAGLQVRGYTILADGPPLEPIELPDLSGPLWVRLRLRPTVRGSALVD